MLVAIILNIPFSYSMHSALKNAQLMEEQLIALLAFACSSKRKIRKTSIVRKGRIKSLKEFLLLTKM